MRRHLTNTFAALQVRTFRILWIGTVFAFVGFFMSMVVQSVVAFKLTGENRAVGLVIFAQGLMMFTLGPLGGALADRLPKRRVIALAQSATTLVYFVISWGIYTERIQLGWLVAGSLVMGASFAFLGPARQSLSVELVPPELRGNAVALTQVANSGCRVLGPAFGGAILHWRADGAWVAYLAMGLFYLTSTLSVSLLPKSVVREGARAAPVFQDMLDGLRYVRQHPHLKTLMIVYTLVIIVGFPHATLLPGFVQNQLGELSEKSSILFGLTAFGALAASLVVAAMADSSRGPKLLSRLAVGFGASLIAVALAPNFLSVALLMVVVGVFSGGFQTLGGAVIVRNAETRYVGRVMSLMMLSFGGFGLMGLPIGALADAVGERVTFAALGLVACGVVAVLRNR